MKIEISLQIIDLDSNGYHILLPAKIGKSELNSFIIIDTGASKSVIDESILELTEYRVIEADFIESSQLTDMIQGSIVEINSIWLDEFNFPNFEALSMSLQHINTIYSKFVDKPIIGLLGGDFLMKYNAEILYKKKLIKLQI